MNKKQFIMTLFSGFFLSAFFIFSTCQYSSAGEKIEASKGQAIYVPAYSHIYIGNNEQPFLLTITLSIRNIDRKNPIKITLVNYYETQGQLLKEYLSKPLILKPLESLRYVIPEKDKTGGSGANFMVEWQAQKPVNPPVVETIMIGAKSQQGVSFTSRGRVLIDK